MNDVPDVLRDAICLTRSINGLTAVRDEEVAERELAIFTLHQQEGWTVRRIGKALGISGPRVWKIIDRHKRRLGREETR